MARAQYTLGRRHLLFCAVLISSKCKVRSRCSVLSVVPERNLSSDVFLRSLKSRHCCRTSMACSCLRDTVVPSRRQYCDQYSTFSHLCVNNPHLIGLPRKRAIRVCSPCKINATQLSIPNIFRPDRFPNSKPTFRPKSALLHRRLARAHHVTPFTMLRQYRARVAAEKAKQEGAPGHTMMSHGRGGSGESPSIFALLFRSPFFDCLALLVLSVEAVSYFLDRET